MYLHQRSFLTSLLLLFALTVASVVLEISNQDFPDHLFRRHQGRILQLDLPQSIDVFTPYPPYLNQSFNHLNYTNFTDWTPATAAPFTHYVEPPPPVVPPSVLFSVKGECRNCMADDGSTFQLFDDAFLRRLLLQAPIIFMESTLKTEMSDDHHLYLRHLQSSNNTCICLQGVAPSPEGPSMDEFQQMYSNQVAKYIEAGQINSVIALPDKMLEVNSFDCGSGANLFESVVFTKVEVR